MALPHPNSQALIDLWYLDRVWLSILEGKASGRMFCMSLTSWLCWIFTYTEAFKAHFNERYKLHGSFSAKCPRKSWEVA